MNYRGAKVNISGVVSKKEVHSAWLQLQQLKARGQQYFKGSNCKIISAGYGDIIKLQGKPAPGQKAKEIKLVKEQRKIPVTITCFAYDEVIDSKSTGNYFICLPAISRAPGVYYDVFDFPNFTPSVKVAAKDLVESERNLDDLVGHPAWDSTKTGIDSYPWTGIAEGSFEIKTAYAVAAFCESTSISATVISRTSYLGGKVYPGSPEWDGVSGVMRAEITSPYLSYTFWPDVNITIPAKVKRPGHYLGQDGGGIGRGLPLLPNKNPLGDYGFYYTDPNYPAELLYYQANCYVTPNTMAAQTGIDVASHTISYFIGYLTRVNVKHTLTLVSRNILYLPKFGMIGVEYTESIPYDGITALDNERQVIYMQGIPVAYKEYVTTSYTTTLSIEINSTVVYHAQLGDDIIVKQALIYKVNDKYIHFIHLLVNSISHMYFVFTKNSEGNYVNILSNNKLNYPHLRVVTVECLLNA